MTEATSTPPKISVVVPVYDERESLPELIDELTLVLDSGKDYELIFVDDGSTDGSGEYLRGRARSDSGITILRFLRNYGKSAALSAGFKRATGDVIVSIDADLQDDPREISKLVDALDEGYDLVSGWKRERKDPPAKRFSSRLFNFTTRLMTDVRIHDLNCGLKAYRKTLAKSLDLYGGMHRYVPVLAAQKGFRVSEVVVNHRPRKYGATKYGRERYFHGLFDLLTVLFLGRYTRRPLHLFGIFGLVSLFAGFAVNVWILYMKYAQGEPFQRHMPLLVFGVLLLILGVQFISIGLLGEMIAQTHRGAEERVVQVIEGTSRPEA